MIKMRLLKRQLPYNHQRYQQGDVFDAYEKDVRVLELAKIAERVTGNSMAATKRKRGRPAGTIKKAGEPKTTRTKTAATSKRVYRRRDMRAEK